MHERRGGTEDFGVICNSIPTAQVAEIFKTSNQTVKMYSFHLKATATLGVVHIPANFLSYRNVTGYLILECPSDPNENFQVPIVIDSKAFNASSRLKIENCDLGRLDFSFLIGFRQLDALMIANSSSMEKANWEILPLLPQLMQIIIRNDNPLIQNDWNKWIQKLPPLTNGLITFICYGGVDDEAADRLVQWLLSSSAATLEHLEMQQTKLTQIPQGISNFENLIDILIITCNKSEIKVLEENAIKFDVLPYKIEISHCGIREIKSGAIKG